MQAIYSAASGLKSQQTRLDTVAANLANTDTAGYKASRVEFKDALYTAMDSPAQNAEAANLRAGSGVLLNSISADFSDGSLTDTGAPLDFAISGNGFFTAEDSSGAIVYTRNGNFSVSPQPDGDYLVTGQGYFVLDSEGNRIRLPGDLTGLSVSPSGVLSTKNGQIAELGIAGFANPDGLLAVGNSCYWETEVSGRAVLVGNDVKVSQGSLELSNVDTAQEMTLLIRSQRAYALASRALQTADEMQGLTNNIH